MRLSNDYEVPGPISLPLRGVFGSIVGKKMSSKMLLVVRSSYFDVHTSSSQHSLDSGLTAPASHPQPLGMEGNTSLAVRITS